MTLSVSVQKSMSAAADTFTGCFLGLALGDALCAPYEGGPAERLLWFLIGRTRTGRRRYTDDTRMSLDVAESLCRNDGVDQDDLARTFAASYRWSRGYGPGTAKMLKKIRKGVDWQEVNRARHPEGSYGNGAAMRAPVIALFFYGDGPALGCAVRQVSEITHAHPLAQEGAYLVAQAVSMALSRQSPVKLLCQLQKQSRRDEYQARLQTARRWLEENDAVDSKTVVRQLGNSMAALDSCVTALYIGLRYIKQPFTDMLAFIQQCGGDTDTIGAMAGAVWGAYNGRDRLNRADIEALESAGRIEQLAEKLYARHLQL